MPLSALVSRAAKRGLDLAVALAALPVALPLLSISALCIWLEDRGPVFFTQPRAGRLGLPCKVYKLRSMRVDVPPPEAVGQVLAGNALVTRTGHWIRRLKLDELPQVWNVLNGDMSIVGPRPALLRDLAGYDEVDRERLSVRPGMTGWAQVNGGVQLTWPERISLDVWYVRHWSLWLDLVIILRTLGVILHGERPRMDVLRAAEAEVRCG